MENKLRDMRAEETKSNQELELLNEQMTSQLNLLNDIEQKINEIHAEEIRLDGQIDLNNRQVGFNQERIQNIKQNEGRLTEQKEQLIEKCRVQQEKLEVLKKELEGFEETMAGKQHSLKEKQMALESINNSIDRAKAQIKEDEEKILTLTSKQVSVRNDLTDTMKELQGAIARKRRLVKENEKVKGEQEEVTQKLQNNEYQINAVQGSVAELRSNKENEEQRLYELQSHYQQMEQQIDDLEKKKLFLKSQRDFVEKLNTQYQDIPDPVTEGRLITDQPPKENLTGIIGKVKSVSALNTKPFSLVRFLTRKEQKKLYEIICETKYVELDLEQLSVKINEYSQQISRLHSQLGDMAIEVQEQTDRVEKLVEGINEKEKELSVLIAQQKDIQTEVQKLKSELEILEVELSEVIETIQEAKKKEDELNYHLDTINQDVNWCQNDIKEQQTLIDNKAQEQQEVSVVIAQIEADINSSRGRLDEQKSSEREISENLDAWLEEIKRIEDEQSSSVTKVQNYKRESEQLTAKVEEIREQRESLYGIVHKHAEEKEEVADKINSMREQTNEMQERIQAVKQRISDQRLNEQELNFGSQGIKDRLMQTYRIDYDEALEKDKEYRQRQLELEQAQAAQEEQPVATGEDEQEQSPAEETKEVDPQEAEGDPGDAAAQAVAEIVNAEEQEAQPEPEPEVEELCEIPDYDPQGTPEILEKLRKKCDSFGSVNLGAMDEYEELKERFEFLTQQQADLLEAKSQLMSTINKINRSTRQMFMDTFTKVSEEFRIYFRMLFGGGEANLVLLDPDNVLESGIDIVARPPGKKLQNISLLSGGEKTLTAIALIFGVFKVNPSPFCVLDEIDAALDESNVGRFSYLLRDFAKIAQFIVITHNKKTISSSDVMYGITMPETGVSRVVSVKFQDDEEETTVEETASV